MPIAQPASYNPNSLWRNGSRAFFNDQRAHQFGDILTVKVNINDTAQFQDQTRLNRSTTLAARNTLGRFGGKRRSCPARS